MSIEILEKFRMDPNLKIQSRQDLLDLRHIEGAVSSVGNDEIDIGRKPHSKYRSSFRVLHRIVFDVHHAQVFPVDQFTGLGS